MVRINEPSKFYVCDQPGCVGSVSLSKGLPGGFEGCPCTACKTGKFIRYREPKYVGWRVEGETEYRHKAP